MCTTLMRLLLCVVLFSATNVSAQIVSPLVINPGTDCWSTDCGRTRYAFCDTPIPAGFFDPGSLPFEGTVQLEGGTGIIDTQISRLNQMVLPDMGAVATTPIEMVALNLVSCDPIIVQSGTGDTLWDVEVSLSADPVPLGQMTVVREHPNGGIFQADLVVKPVFTFTQVGGTGAPLVFDPNHAVQIFNPVPAPWVNNIPPTAGMSCAPGFAPGYAQQPGLGQCCVPIGYEGQALLHEMRAPNCQPCTLGACLDLATLSCGIADEALCTSSGGIFVGAGYPCIDSDGDGLPDYVETNNCCSGFVSPLDTGTDPFNPDTDGDGQTDGQEVQAGTDPCGTTPQATVITAGQDC